MKTVLAQRRMIQSFAGTFACLLIAALTPVKLAFAQGTVEFNNRKTGITISHVYAPPPSNIPQVGNGSADLPAGTTDWSGFAGIGQNGLNGQYGGTKTLAQLLVLPGADQPDEYLVPASSTTTFRTGAAAGFLSAITTTLSNVPVDATVATVQMVAWDNSSGAYPTWSEASTAWHNGLIAAGKSVPINTYNIGGGTNAAPSLTGLQSFCLYFGTLAHQPHILSQPASQTATIGQSLGLRVLVSGSDPVSYQWKFNGADMPSATNSVYSIPSVEFEDAGSYSVLVWTPYYTNQISSATAVLTVQGAPAINTPPHDQSALVGQSASFNVSAVGTPTLLYQWQFYGTNLPGSTSTSLALTNVQLSQAGDYRVIVTNSYGSVTSSPAHLTVADFVMLNAYTAIELEFRTRSNTVYYIQASPDYVAWANFDGPITGNGQLWSKTYSTRDSGPLFYRVTWVP